MKNFLLFFTAFSSFTLSNIYSANAVILNWQFTNENGSFGNPTDIISGFVEFDDSEVFPNATNVNAINLQITNVTGLTSTSFPFFGNGGIEQNTNLLIGNTVLGNSIDFDSEGNVSSYRLSVYNNGFDRFYIVNDESFTGAFLGQNTVAQISDNNADTVQFKSSRSVPEPLTILGAGTAVAFGTGFKRKLAKAKKK